VHNMVRLWDVGTGKEIRFADGYEWNVVSVGWSNDGKTTVSIASARDGTIRKWDAATGKGLGQIDVGFGWPMAALSADGRIAAVCQDGADVRLWNVADGKELPSPKMGKMWGTPAVSPSGQMLATPAADGGVCLSDIRTGKMLRKLGSTLSYNG